jgi:ABC-type multidrug transport system fused ATPase/permease subunit
MVVTAFATRDVFVHLREGGAEPRAALFALAAAGTGLCALRAFEGRVGERVGQSYAAAIRMVLFRHVARMPASAVAERRSGALALRYVGDLAAFKGWIARGLARLISAAATIPAALMILYLLEPRLLWAAIGPIAAVLAGIALLGPALGRAHADLRAKRARLAAAMAERLPQAIALRRSGRMRTETRALSARSRAVADAGVRREWLAATVRALPDAGAGLAGALCLWVCLRLDLGIPEAVAALTALGMVVWPLRHLADVADRRRAFGVAAAKLDRMLAAERLPAPGRADGSVEAPAILIEGAEGALPDLILERGERRWLAGPGGAEASRMLTALAGLDLAPPARRFEVCGASPGALKAGRVLYLGRQTPSLRGSLRREATLGIGRSPDDDEIAVALERAGLAGLLERLGGLGGRVAEARRNLSADERSRLTLARAFLARPDLALIDADEIGLRGDLLARFLERVEEADAAALVVTSDPEATLRLGAPLGNLPARRTAPPVAAEPFAG